MSTELRLRIDTVAAVQGSTRTDLIYTAVVEYLDRLVDDEEFQEALTAYLTHLTADLRPPEVPT
jgi:hypothetical protein